MTTTLLSVRMTAEEKARLESEADHAGMKLSAYVRQQLLGGKAAKPRVRESHEGRVVKEARTETVHPVGMTAYERLLAEQKARR